VRGSLTSGRKSDLPAMNQHSAKWHPQLAMAYGLHRDRSTGLRRRSDKCQNVGSDGVGQGREAPSGARAALTRAIASGQSRFGASVDDIEMGIHVPNER
jgi:hypothetical protein